MFNMPKIRDITILALFIILSRSASAYSDVCGKYRSNTTDGNGGRVRFLRICDIT